MSVTVRSTVRRPYESAIVTDWIARILPKDEFGSSASVAKRPLFDHGAAVEDDDFVGVLQRADAVGDDAHGAARAMPGHEPVHHHLFCRGIQRRCGFVQQQD